LPNFLFCSILHFFYFNNGIQSMVARFKILIYILLACIWYLVLQPDLGFNCKLGDWRLSLTTLAGLYLVFWLASPDNNIFHVVVFIRILSELIFRHPFRRGLFLHILTLNYTALHWAYLYHWLAHIDVVFVISREVSCLINVLIWLVIRLLDYIPFPSNCYCSLEFYEIISFLKVFWFISYTL